MKFVKLAARWYRDKRPLYRASIIAGIATLLACCPLLVLLFSHPDGEVVALFHFHFVVLPALIGPVWFWSIAYIYQTISTVLLGNAEYGLLRVYRIVHLLVIAVAATLALPIELSARPSLLETDYQFDKPSQQRRYHRHVEYLDHLIANRDLLKQCTHLAEKTGIDPSRGRDVQQEHLMCVEQNKYVMHRFGDERHWTNAVWSRDMRTQNSVDLENLRRESKVTMTYIAYVSSYLLLISFALSFATSVVFCNLFSSQIVSSSRKELATTAMVTAAFCCSIWFLSYLTYGVNMSLVYLPENGFSNQKDAFVILVLLVIFVGMLNYGSILKDQNSVIGLGMISIGCVLVPKLFLGVGELDSRNLLYFYANELLGVGANFSSMALLTIIVLLFGVLAHFAARLSNTVRSYQKNIDSDVES